MNHSNSQTALQHSIKIATLNVRNSLANDGINCWDNRKKLVGNYLYRSNADIFGFQEVLQNQLEYLAEELPTHQHVGVAREDGKNSGEYAPIFFKKDRFELLSSKTIWLSEPPEIVGSKGWDAALPRIATVAKLADKASHKKLLVVNTHFDHVGALARAESILLIRKTIKEFDCKNYIVTGDFNITSTDSAFENTINAPTLLPPLVNTSSYSEQNEKIIEKQSSYHKYGTRNHDYTTDYIFTNIQSHIIDYKINIVKENNIFISDHYPVSSRIVLSL